MEDRLTCPLPEDPALAEVAAALNDAGYWADIVDRHWRSVYVTDAQRLTSGGLLELVPYPIIYFGPEAVSARLGWRGSGQATLR